MFYDTIYLSVMMQQCTGLLAATGCTDICRATAVSNGL